MKKSELEKRNREKSPPGSGEFRQKRNDASGKKLTTPSSPIPKLERLDKRKKTTGNASAVANQSGNTTLQPSDLMSSEKQITQLEAFRRLQNAIRLTPEQAEAWKQSLSDARR